MSAKQYLFICTGGTLDAEEYTDPQHPPAHATMLEGSLATQEIRALMGARGLKEGYDFDILEWRMKDSKDFTPDDLIELAGLIRTAPAQKIIITHGTDAMAPNARAVKRMLKDSRKYAAFTGAMIPLANGRDSDGPGNLCDAVKAVDRLARTRPQGDTCIVFGGKVFDPDHTDKNMAEKRFESACALAL